MVNAVFDQKSECIVKLLAEMFCGVLEALLSDCGIN